MKILQLIRRIPTRVHLAIGLAALSVCMVLSASYLGLIPDMEAQIRQHRAALSETIALGVSTQLDEDAPEPLRETLVYLLGRNPGLLSIGVRAQTGELLIDTGEHEANWSPGDHEQSSDAEITIPVWRSGQSWGRVELRFKALRDPGWLGHLQDPSLRLSLFAFASCFGLFHFYLKKMLRELDPKRAVPARVRAAYDTLTEGLIVLDKRGSIVLANKSTSEMLGVDEASMMGRSASEFSWTRSDGEPLLGMELPWELAMASKQAQRDVHLGVTSRKGTRYSLQANCSPLLDPAGELQALVLSFQDVTELELRGVALQVAKEEADAANMAKSQFLANMSHEIRTPMNAILGFTEVLRRGGLDRSGESAKHLDIIHSSGRHLLNLINDILDLSKVESGRMEAERLVFAPHRVVQDAVQTLRERAEQKGLALNIVFAQALPSSIEGDPARLRQILTNLIGNAIKFTERGAVTVRLRLEEGKSGKSGTSYCIDVQDSGIGIPADKLEAVFEPFVQAESSTTRRFGGTGLGLTISRGLARVMGGDLVASSVYGEGACFTLSLDAGELDSAPLLTPTELAASTAPVTAAPATRWQFPPARILVVDDGVENRQLLRVLLEDLGLRIEEAENGQIALDRVTAEEFDLVLMDMQMPVMDGQTATLRMRERGFKLPIVALTANAMKGFERELEASGFSGYLTKPIDIDLLLADLAGRLGAVEQKAASDHPRAAVETLVLAPPQTAHRLVSRLAGHAKIGRIAARFVEQLPAKLRTMEAALEREDLQGLADLAHWLKGAGGSMGFDDLFEPAKALEDAALAGHSDKAHAVMKELCQLEQAILLGAQGPGAQQTETQA